MKKKSRRSKMRTNGLRSWQKGVDKAAATPENQARMAKFRKTEPKAAHPVWSYGFADRLEGTPDPKDFGFRDSQKAAASHPENDRANSWLITSTTPDCRIVIAAPT